jgi:nitrite transporter NirC
VRDLLGNWLWTWLGNLAGSVLIAFLVVRAGLLDVDKFPSVNAFVLSIFKAKTDPVAEELFWRAILANWLVCLGVWMAARVKSEAARILLIFWCMFTFITSGYEHSIANMCGLMLGLLVPNHGADVTLGLYAYNLGLTTLGNIVGGAVFVGGAYWLGSPRAREQPAEKVVVGSNGALAVSAAAQVKKIG